MASRVRFPSTMRTPDPAPSSALALLAAAAATAAVGVAALARAGAALCGHRVLVHHHAPGMAMAAVPTAAVPADGICPILLYAAAVAGALCVLAVVVLLASRAGAPAVLAAAARWVAGLQFGPLTAVIGLAGAAPLAAILASEGGVTGLSAAGALAALVAGAFAGALALAGAARVVLAFARRLAVALAAAFRLLVPGGGALRFVGWEPLPSAAGMRLARRRPSRAPPVLR